MADMPYFVIKYKYIRLNRYKSYKIISFFFHLTNYSLQVLRIQFQHLKENHLSIRITNSSLKSEGKRRASGPATQALSISAHQSFTQTLNSTVGMFSSLVISKALSRKSAQVIGISSFHFSVR